jgi:hypothetical protein
MNEDMGLNHLGIRPTTPAFVSQDIEKLCRQIDPSTEPVYIRVQPELWCEMNQCFDNAARYEREHGGCVQYGWLIWEMPRLLVEAEFHAAWLSPDGSLIDVTPKVDGESQVLFLPDSNRAYDGTLVDNVRRPLSDDPYVRQCIAQSELMFRMRQKHFRNGRVDVDSCLREFQMRVRDLNMPARLNNQSRVGRNDPCPCGSGRKYKKCCGSA